MKHLITLSILTCFCHALQAQNLIAVEHNGQSSFFTELQPALDAAVDGDTVYLPGATYGEMTLNKRLAVIGAGYFPDSATAINPTLLQNITIEDGSSGGMITGLRILGGFVFVNGEVHNFEISRCELVGLIISNNLSSNFLIKENIVGNANFGESNSHTFANNVVYFGVSHGSNISISNNIFQASDFTAPSLSYLDHSTISNNIIHGPISGQYCVFRNNWTLYPTQLNGNNGSNFGIGNFFDNSDFNSLFVNYTGNNYTSDFHLVNPAYNTAGSDGTPVGIYGGLYPWKAGGVPYNPHIQTKTIAPTTNAQGSLNVQIRVAAQDH